MNTNQNTTAACPVMGFMVDQATRTEPVPIIGKPGLVHWSPMHFDKEPDVLPTAGINAALLAVLEDDGE